jgi:hypothetical protein
VEQTWTIISRDINAAHFFFVQVCVAAEPPQPGPPSLILNQSLLLSVLQRIAAFFSVLQRNATQELSRADDLWSIFYVFIEFYQGHLPWRKLKSKEDIGEMKQQYHNSSLVAALPPVFSSFMEHLLSLQYKDTPDYDYLISLVRQLDPRADMQPYDWEGDASVYRCVYRLPRSFFSKAFCSASFVDIRDGAAGGSARASEELGIKVCVLIGVS